MTMSSSRSPRTTPSCAAPPMSRSCSRRQPCSACRRSPSPTATRWPASRARIARRQSHRHAPDRRLPAGSDAMAPPVLVYPTDRARLCRGCAACSPSARPAPARAPAISAGRTWRHTEKACSPSCCRTRPTPPCADNLRASATRFSAHRAICPDLAPPPRRCRPPRQLADMAAVGRACPPWPPATCCITRPDRRILQDVVTCIREGSTIDDAGFRRERFADRHLKPPAEMARLFARYPEALAARTEIADALPLQPVRTALPISATRADRPADTAQQTLEDLTWQGAAMALPGRRAASRRRASCGTSSR